MGFFRVKAGSDKAIIVNSDCGVRLVLDFLKEKLGLNTAVELDLCDEWGNLRFLTQAPVRCSCLLLVASRALYTPVVIRQAPTLQFEFPMGRPVSANTTRDSQRKVRFQWNKYQRLRGGASGRLATDEEAAELIYQVVGRPSADLAVGKGKGKAHDPAPKSARPRSTSVGRKKKAPVAVDSSEEKENEQANSANPTEKKSASVRKGRKAVSIAGEQGRGGSEDDESARSKWETTPADTGVKKASEAIQSVNDPSEVIESPLVNESSKQPGVRNLSEGGQQEEEPKDGTNDSSSNRPSKLMDDDELRGRSMTPSEKTAAKELPKTAGKAVEDTTKITEATVSAKDNGNKSLPGERPIRESTDSGVESAFSGSQRPLKDREMGEPSSDGRSFAMDAASNEESSDAVNMDCKRKIPTKGQTGRRSTGDASDGDRVNVPEILTEPTDAEDKIQRDSPETASNTPQTLPTELADVEDATLKKGSDAMASGSPKTLPTDLADVNGTTTRKGPDTIALGSPQTLPTELADAEDATLRKGPDSAASGTPQKLPGSLSPTDVTIEDIAGVTVSIMPPNLRGSDRRSIDVTALLGIPLVDRTAAAAADRSTRKGIPSLIHEEWRKEITPEQLIGVLSGTSKLVYLGSAKSPTVAGPQIEVVNATEEQAERLGTQTAALAVVGSAEYSESSGAAGEEQDVATTSQVLGSTDEWKITSSVV